MRNPRKTTPRSPERKAPSNPAEFFAEVYRVSEAEACRRSLAEFIKRAWHVVEPGTELLWNWHIDAICLHLEAVTRGDLLKLIINMPPGHMKSLIVAVFWPAWEWTNNPCVRSQFLSYDDGLAIRDSIKTRDLVQSEWYQETFRPDWRLRTDANEKSYFVNTKQGFRRAFAMNGKATGHRGDKVVVDDPLNAKDQYNVGVKADCLWKWDKVFSTRVNDPRKARFVIVMQRLASDDLTGHMLERNTYDHLCLPSEFDSKRRKVTSIGWTDPRTTEGELLFPELFPKDVLDDFRTNTLGEEGYAGQHLQTPVKAGGNKFQRDWFKRWVWADREAKIIRLFAGHDSTLLHLKECRIFGTIDVANSTKKSADYTVISIWAATKDGRIVLLDRFKDRIEDPDIAPKARDLYDEWNVSAYTVEENGMGLGLIQTMQRGLTTGDGRFVPPMLVRGVYVESDKVSRATRAVIASESGRVYIPAESQCDWIGDWLEEITQFPAVNHDDQVDTFSLAAIDVFSTAMGTMKGATAVSIPSRSPNQARSSQEESRHRPDRGVSPGVGSRRR